MITTLFSLPEFNWVDFPLSPVNLNVDVNEYDITDLTTNTDLINEDIIDLTNTTDDDEIEIENYVFESGEMCPTVKKIKKNKKIVKNKKKNKK